MKRDEQGIALVITLFLMAALSALAVSLMFLSQTETASSRNYRTMSQARYAGEAGVHRALNFLITPASYSSPTSLTGYGTNYSPVTCAAGCTKTTPNSCDASTLASAISSGCVVLGVYTANPLYPCDASTAMKTPSNYPDAAVAAAFVAAMTTGNVLAVNSSGATSNNAAGTVTYNVAAILLSMQQVTVYGGKTGIVQSWQIVADGTVPGAIPATVEVTALLEQPIADAETYAIYATDSGCKAITMSGNEVTDSYNSATLTNPSSWSGGAVGSGHPIATSSGGGVGTNGNLDLSGNVDVHGTLTTPRTGVGTCSDGNITAESPTGKANVDNGIVNLPQAKTWASPLPPSPLPGTAAVTINAGSSCTSLILAGLIPSGATCTGLTNVMTIRLNGAPLVWGNVAMSGGANLTIEGGSSSTVNFNVNSFTMAGNASLNLGTNTSLTLNVAGQGFTGTQTVLDFTGGSFTNNTYDSSKFQIIYAGTGTMKAAGGPGAAATIYAPNAYFEMHGNADFYGSVLADKFNDTGGATVHYDSNLKKKFKTLGNYVMTSFSWKKY